MSHASSLSIRFALSFSEHAEADGKKIALTYPDIDILHSA
jgi:hypothetical protein